MACLPNRIREHRLAQGLTLVELAFKASCSVTHLSDLERGGKQFTTRWKFRLARALGVQPDDLLLLEQVEFDLTADERMLLVEYRAASASQRRQIRAILSILKETE